MPGSVFVIWDYDAALGQVNATYPYNFHEEVLLDEIRNVDEILTLAQAWSIKLTFACVGFAAEPGQWPYHVPDQIRRIHCLGHEVASHTWRHEWLPFLEREQLVRTLRRSRQALEACIGNGESVVGFVPPFNRPMTWKGRLAFSLGDRVWGPRFPGSDLGALCRLLKAEGYRWCRVFYVPLWNRLLGRGIQKHLTTHSGITCVPAHYNGFDEAALKFLKTTAETEGLAVITGHPSALSRHGKESREHFRAFGEALARYQQAGKLVARSVNELT